MESRGQGYRNCRRMAINTLFSMEGRGSLICGFVRIFFGRDDMYMRDWLHIIGKGAAVFADGLSAAVDSGMGSIKIFFVANIV